MLRGEGLHDPSIEWLEADGLGGFAMGTANGIHERISIPGTVAVERIGPKELIMNWSRYNSIGEVLMICFRLIPDFASTSAERKSLPS